MSKTHIFLLLLIAVAAGIILSTVGESSSYEDFTTAASQPGKEFHVVGTLHNPGLMQYDPIKDPNLFRFYLKDQTGKVCRVVYHDSKPQDFERSEQVVIIGKMDGQEFTASKILTKCPSKYNEDSVRVSPPPPTTGRPGNEDGTHRQLRPSLVTLPFLSTPCCTDIL
jgi:cytochrome c-type biogenesis protein CcmE